MDCELCQHSEKEMVKVNIRVDSTRPLSITASKCGFELAFRVREGPETFNERVRDNRGKGGSAVVRVVVVRIACVRLFCEW